LGNEQLSLLLLQSIHCGFGLKENESFKMTQFHEMKVCYEESASQFASYSTDELRELPKQTLHELLLSESLSLDSEDALLQRLIELGSEYFEYWNYVEV
jgi:hypothetical protein